MKYEIPITETLLDELFSFWDAIFGGELPDFDRPVFLGAEKEYSRSTLYLQREGEEVAGTAFCIRSQSIPRLAGMGEVATDPALRGRGIASSLCKQVLADFHAAGGEAFFLGTVNPAAARIYHRLGWRKLAGANVMVNIRTGLAPEEYLADYFRRPGKVTVSLAGPDVRLPMIPLILTPHDSQLLDANVDLYSCRYRTQNSCMGLYPRYVRTLQEVQGAFFAACTEDGRVVGLATARPDDQTPLGHVCQIDGFVHHNFPTALHDLIEAASTWARSHGTSTLNALISQEDEKKQAVFDALGFAYEGPREDFNDSRLAKWACHR